MYKYNVLHSAIKKSLLARFDDIFLALKNIGITKVNILELFAEYEAYFLKYSQQEEALSFGKISHYFQFEFFNKLSLLLEGKKVHIKSLKEPLDSPQIALSIIFIRWLKNKLQIEKRLTLFIYLNELEYFFYKSFIRINFDEIINLLSSVVQEDKKLNVIENDSFLIDLPNENKILKIPSKKPYEEIYLLRKLHSLGLNVPTIRKTGKINVHGISIPYYVMDKIPKGIEIIKYSNRYIRKDYYKFLDEYFKRIPQKEYSGWGSLTLDKKKLIKFEFKTEKQLLLSVLERIQLRSVFPKSYIDTIGRSIQHFSFKERKSVMVHTDLLNNILYSTKNDEFYILDPQTIVSFSNKYWDLAYYIIYAIAFNCTQGLQEFLSTFKDLNNSHFILTCKVLILERMSFYLKYQPDPVIIANLNRFKDNIFSNKLIV